MITVTAALVGGPTIVLRYAGLTIVTDPTFDPPGPNGYLVKTEGPAIDADALPPSTWRSSPTTTTPTTWTYWASRWRAGRRSR